MIRTIHWLVLSKIKRERGMNLNGYTEGVRQRVIDLAMHEPPLVDMEGDQVVITEAGKTALANRELALRS